MPVARIAVGLPCGLACCGMVVGGRLGCKISFAQQLHWSAMPVRSGPAAALPAGFGGQHVLWPEWPTAPNAEGPPGPAASSWEPTATQAAPRADDRGRRRSSTSRSGTESAGSRRRRPKRRSNKRRKKWDRGPGKTRGRAKACSCQGSASSESPTDDGALPLGKSYTFLGFDGRAAQRRICGTVRAPCPGARSTGHVLPTRQRPFRTTPAHEPDQPGTCQPAVGRFSARPARQDASFETPLGVGLEPFRAHARAAKTLRPVLVPQEAALEDRRCHARRAFEPGGAHSFERTDALRDACKSVYMLAVLLLSSARCCTAA